MVQLATELEDLQVGSFVTIGDLKLRNIFISEKFKIRIGDFGFSQINGEHQRIIGSSPGYAAPECYDPNFNEPTFDHQRSIDTFSLGVIYFRLIYGIEPFYDTDLHQTDLKWNLLKNIGQGQIEFWNKHQQETGLQTPPDFKEMIQGMLNPNSSERWSVQQVLGCQYLQGEGEIANEQEVSAYIEQRLQNQN